MVEFDFAWQDILLPYNCRSQICDMLAVDESKRSKIDSQLSTEIIRRLSPSLLQIPINSQTKTKYPGTHSQDTETIPATVVTLVGDTLIPLRVDCNDSEVTIVSR